MVINFPPFFTIAVCRLLLAVCRLPFSTRKGLFSCPSTTQVSFLKFSVRSATIISLCLSPVMFYLFFYANLQTDRSTVTVYTKGKKKVRESEPMFGCYLHKDYQLFYAKTPNCAVTSKQPKETTFNR